MECLIRTRRNSTRMAIGRERNKLCSLQRLLKAFLLLSHAFVGADSQKGASDYLASHVFVEKVQQFVSSKILISQDLSVLIVGNWRLGCRHNFKLDDGQIFSQNGGSVVSERGDFTSNYHASPDQWMHQRARTEHLKTAIVFYEWQRCQLYSISDFPDMPQRSKFCEWQRCGFYSFREFPDIPDIPQMSRFCYELPLEPDSTTTALPNYLIRATFPSRRWTLIDKKICREEPDDYDTASFYFSVDGVTSIVVELDAIHSTTLEMIISPPPAGHLHICLKPLGWPMAAISSLELRPLSPGVEFASLDHFLLTHSRLNFGGDPTTALVRYPDDPYDRLWTSPEIPSKQSDIIRMINISSNGESEFFGEYHVPKRVIETAWEATEVSDVLVFMFNSSNIVIRSYWATYSGLKAYSYVYDGYSTFPSIIAEVEVADGQNHDQTFFLAARHFIVQTHSDPSDVTLTVRRLDSNSTRPLINAAELYLQMKVDKYTFLKDVADFKNLVNTLALSKYVETIGDPCVPVPLLWIGCTSVHDRTSKPRITSIDLARYSYNPDKCILESIWGLGNLSFDSLTDLNLKGSHCFNGDFPASFAELPTLRTLTLHDNDQPGVLHLQNLPVKSLRVLDLSSNSIGGMLPVELNRLTQLQHLNLDHNELTGELKLDFRALKALKSVTLYNNKLSGTIPDDIWHNPNLEYVDLQSNEFTVLNLSTWYKAVQTRQLPLFRVVVSLVSNRVSQIIPSSVEHLDLEINAYEAYGAILLGNNEWCYNRKPWGVQNSSLPTVVHFLCRYFEREAPDTWPPSRTDAANLVNSSKFIIAMVIGGVVASIIAIVLVYFLWKLRQRSLELQQIQEALAKENVKPPFFSYHDIRAATGGFSSSRILGRGGFGTVFKAEFSDGTELAVKRLNATEQSTSEFLKEIVCITGIKHRHLIQLKGCCIRDKDHRILIYEYAENRSLANALWSQSDASYLSWSQRLNIALGIARGLVYLHEELQPMIVHRDIKPQNILLDKEYNAKIADFGLVRPSHTQDTQVTSNIGGTRGYSPPEYLMEGLVSEKVDVYGFGVVLLEIVSGRLCIEVTTSGERVYIPSLASHLQAKGHLLDLVDEKLTGNFDKEEAELMLQMGLACCNLNPKQRPTMSQVVSDLLKHTSLPITISSRVTDRIRPELLLLHTVAEEDPDDSAFQISESASEELSLISQEITRSV